MPIFGLTAGEKSSPLKSEKLRKKWLEFQKELATLSDHTKHLIVEGSGHYFYKNKPEVVIGEINRMVKSCNKE